MAAEPRLNVTQLLGGQGIVYQRSEGGSWYCYFGIKAEKKRFRKALGTTDKALPSERVSSCSMMPLRSSRLVTRSLLPPSGRSLSDGRSSKKPVLLVERFGAVTTSFRFTERSRSS